MDGIANAATHIAKRVHKCTILEMYKLIVASVASTATDSRTCEVVPIVIGSFT